MKPAAPVLICLTASMCYTCYVCLKVVYVLIHSTIVMGYCGQNAAQYGNMRQSVTDYNKIWHPMCTYNKLLQHVGHAWPFYNQ